MTTLETGVCFRVQAGRLASSPPQPPFLWASRSTCSCPPTRQPEPLPLSRPSRCPCMRHCSKSTIVCEDGEVNGDCVKEDIQRCLVRCRDPTNTRGTSRPRGLGTAHLSLPIAALQHLPTRSIPDLPLLLIRRIHLKRVRDAEYSERMLHACP